MDRFADTSHVLHATSRGRGCLRNVLSILCICATFNIESGSLYALDMNVDSLKYQSYKANGVCEWGTKERLKLTVEM